MSELRAVLWDMDGTLIASEPSWILAQRTLVEQHGGTWSDGDGFALIGSDMETTAAAISAKGVPGSAEDISRVLTERVADALRGEIRWRPGAVALVRALRDAGVPQAIVTTSPMNIVEIVVAALPAGAISVLVTEESVERGKPDPQPYLLAAQRLGVKIHHCVAIEDSPTGLQAAVRSGAAVLAVPCDVPIELNRSWARVDTLEGLTVTDLADLPLQSEQ
ncbi:HAD family phosphatase [Curtobacterium sp. NPDC089185]|uniref:HAD family hydrolase n=1 Tax=Curtobacterium sp. NPDC089185 TaxID=3154968 RepID=UPI0034237D09